MAVDYIYQTIIHSKHQNNANAYCWYFRVSTEVVADDVPDDLLVVITAIQSAMRSLHTTDVNFECNEVRQIWPNNSLPQIGITDEAGTRTTTASLPGQCSCVVTLYGDTTNPTKFNRGRDFLYGMDEADQGNGLFTVGPGYLTDVDTFYAARSLITAQGGNEFEWGNFSMTKAKLLGALATYWFPMELMRSRQLVRTQRRRQPLDPCEVVLDSTPLPPS